MVISGPKTCSQSNVVTFGRSQGSCFSGIYVSFNDLSLQTAASCSYTDLNLLFSDIKVQKNTKMTSHLLHKTILICFCLDADSWDYHFLTALSPCSLLFISDWVRSSFYWNSLQSIWCQDLLMRLCVCLCFRIPRRNEEHDPTTNLTKSSPHR